MKIHVPGDKIVKTVKKLQGIELVLENTEDAQEAIDLIVQKAEIPHLDTLKEYHITATRQYETSAVQYKLWFLLEFHFQEGTALETRVAVIKGLQRLFDSA
jgi:hypothetical protein